MYRVTVKKSLQRADGSTTIEESQEEVNHERHALNLAGKIARTASVHWVEIEETTGRFKVRASRTSDGTVQESLQSLRRMVRRKTRFQLRHRSRTRMTTMTWLALFGVVAFIVSTVTGSKDAGTAAAAVCLILALFVAVRGFFRRRSERSRN